MKKLKIYPTSTQQMSASNKINYLQSHSDHQTSRKIRKLEWARSNSRSLQSRTTNGSLCHETSQLSKDSATKVELSTKSIILPLINLQINKKEHIYKRMTKNSVKLPAKSNKIIFEMSHRYQNNYNKQAKSNAQKYSYCFKTQEGLRIYNEDRIAIQSFQICEDKYQYFAIFDGHGGHTISNYLANYFHVFLKEELSLMKTPLQAMKQTINKIQHKIKKKFKMIIKGGSCALIALILQKECWIANIGDSRLLTIDFNGNFQQITKDHKPQNDLQRWRIQENGGRVCRLQSQNPVVGKGLPFRVYPGGLSVSRTIGDFQIKKKNSNLVICQPQLHYLDLSKFKKILMFSDGVYDKFSNKQISNFFLSSQGSEMALNELFKAAAKSKSQDNRSLILIDLI